MRLIFLIVRNGDSRALGKELSNGVLGADIAEGWRRTVEDLLCSSRDCTEVAVKIGELEGGHERRVSKLRFEWTCGFWKSIVTSPERTYSPVHDTKAPEIPLK